MRCFQHETTQKQAHLYFKIYHSLLKNSIIYKNGSKPTINQGICSVNSATAHRNRSVFVSLSCFCCIPTFLLIMSYCKRRETVPAGLLVTFTSCCLSVPTSRSHFLIQLVLCSPTVKVKVCELLRGRTFEKESVCVCTQVKWEQELLWRNGPSRQAIND